MMTGVKRCLRGAVAAAVGSAVGSWLLGCWQPSVDAGNVTPAGTESCALTSETPAGVRTLFCVETSGLTVNQAQGQQSYCEAEPRDAGAWRFASDACPREGALGGCRLTTDITQKLESTDWYYSGGIYLRSDGEAGAPGATMPPCLSNYTFVAP
jgi:hypothetical protein